MAKFAYCRCRTLFYCLIYGCKDNAMALYMQIINAENKRSGVIYTN